MRGIRPESSSLFGRSSGGRGGSRYGIPLAWLVRGGSRLAELLGAGPAVEISETARAGRIEELAAEAETAGPLPLWEGYASLEAYPYPVRDATRTSDGVRIDRAMGNFFACLVEAIRPETVLEIGTAFGVSGMYWLAGLEANGRGELVTFEPNGVWAELARKNLAAIGRRYRLVVGTFEEHLAAALPGSRGIDVAFVDGIHTAAAIEGQYELLVPRMRPGGLVLFDDTDFSPEMASSWHTIATSERVAASAVLAGRVGIVELSVRTVP